VLFEAARQRRLAAKIAGTIVQKSAPRSAAPPNDRGAQKGLGS
jgi:hypothetical protein